MGESELKKKVLASASQTLAKVAQKEDPSASLDSNLKQEAAKDNHDLIRSVKDHIKLRVPVIVNGCLFVLAGLVIFFFVYATCYTIRIWSETEKIEAILKGALAHTGSFIFGTLAAILFKSKK